MMTEAERERGFDTGNLSPREISGSDAMAEWMHPAAQVVRRDAALVFIHAAPRTSSTWFWSKFREHSSTLCFYEPFNSDLGWITRETAATWVGSLWQSRHPSIEPYYQEYLPFIQESGAVELFDPAMPFQWFIPLGGLRGELRQSEKDYLSLLVRHAHAAEKVPVFKFIESLGRLRAIRNVFGGFHIFLHRNLWKQWLSYLYYSRRAKQFFYESTARIAVGADDPFLAAMVEFYLRRAFDFRVRRDDQENQPLSDDERLRLLILLPESHAFAMFMALHIYLHLHAQLTADLTVDVTRLAKESEYRFRTESELSRQTGLEISLSDVADEQQASGVAIGAATIDWDEIRDHARTAVQILSAFGDPTEMMENASAFIDSAIEEMHKSETALAMRHDAAEEIWFARVQEARCHWALGDDDGFVRQALDLCKERPNRAEPLFDLARFHRERGMHEEAAQFAEAGLALDRPGDQPEFVEDIIYQYGLREELSIAAFYSSDPARKDRGFAACNWLALNREIPEDTRNVAREHLYFYVVPASKLMPSFVVRPVGFSPPDGWRPTTPSLTRRGDEILVVQPAVKYALEDHNHQASDGLPIATRNFLLRLDSSLEIESSIEILPPANLPMSADGQVRAFEDVRLFAWRGALWCSATLRELTEEGWGRQVLARIDQGPDGKCLFAYWRVLWPEERRDKINWMPLVEPAAAEAGGERLRFVYLCDPTRIVDDGAQLVAESTPAIAADKFRGATQAIEFDGGWLALIHEQAVGDTFTARHHRFIWLDGSWALRGVSRPFFFQRPSVEAAAGLAWHPDGGHLVISYGVDDGETCIASVDVTGVRAVLEDAGRLPSGDPLQAVAIPALRTLETELRAPESENPPVPNLGSLGDDDFVSQHALRPARDMKSRLDAYPRVLVAILAKQKEQALPLFLRCIEGLDYPKSSIVLYVRTNNNTDRTEEILREWIARVGPAYAGVELDATPVAEPVETFGQHEWNATRFRVLGNIRNVSLSKTNEHGCDFYFVCDLDNFILPCTLRELVALKLPIVGPLLRVTDPYAYHSNFFAAVDPNGFYADCDQYRWIVHRWIRGVCEVPVVHCTYLIRSDVIPQLRYLDGSDRHEFLVFSESARKAGIPQYLDNRQLYGYITFDAESDGAKVTLGDRRRDQLATAERELARAAEREPPSAAMGDGVGQLTTLDATDMAAPASVPYLSDASNTLPIHVINLDRTPARLAEFNRRNAHLRDVKRFRAIDGQTLDREKLIRDGVLTADCIYTAGNLGCAMSHLALWRKVVEEGRAITVAEDDAIFSRNFAGRSREFLEHLPEDWEFIQWGWVFQQRVWVHAIPEILNATLIFDQDQLRRHIDEFQSCDVAPAPITLRHSFGTVCYSVSLKGARALLQYCTPLSGRLIEFPGFGVTIENKGIDCMMNGAYPSLKAFVSIPPLVVTEHREDETTTRHGGVDRFDFNASVQAGGESAAQSAALGPRASLDDAEPSSSSLQSKARSLQINESRTYSQNGEDGVIESIFSHIGTIDKFFVEIGCADGSECNTRKLSELDGWSGIRIDNNHSNDGLRIFKCTVDHQNACTILHDLDIRREFDLLSIDIDFNDFHVLRAILAEFAPRVIITEFNSSLGPLADLVVPYLPKHRWDYTNFFGASYTAFQKLAKAFGYELVYCESQGVNLFLIRGDVVASTGVSFEARYRPPGYWGGAGHPLDSLGRKYLSSEHYLLPGVATASTGFGNISYFQNDQYIGNAFALGWYWDEGIIREIANRLGDAAGVVLDIGAHVGSHSVALASLKPSLRFICFEPQRPLFLLLERNIHENGLCDRVRAENVAVGHAPGRGWVSSQALVHETNAYKAVEYGEGSPTNLGGVQLSSEGQPCEVIRIDDLALSPVPYIKIDIEGAEPLAFHGMQLLLARDLPLVHFEDRDDRQLGVETLDALGVEADVREFSPRGHLLSLGYEVQRFGYDYLACPPAIPYASLLSSRPAGDAIPKRIFQTWKSKVDFPHNFQYWLSTFKQVNPDFDQIIWDDNDNARFISSHFDWFLPTYRAYPREIYRADAISYFFLYTFGGIYADMDVECLRPLDGLLGRADVLLGRMGGDIDHPHSIPNAIMASKPKQEFWLLVISLLIDAAKKKEEPEYVTGPVVLKSAVDLYLSREPRRARSAIEEIARYLPAELLPEQKSSNVDVLPSCEWFALNWTDPIHWKLRRDVLDKGLLSEEDKKELFPHSSMVTYWTHTH
jgi:FkbM family methyltransferase